MYWYIKIAEQLDDGMSVSEIVEYFSHPLITEKYVLNIIKARKSLTQKRKNVFPSIRKESNAPSQGSELRKVWDYAMSVGGVEKFKIYYREQGSHSLARQLGVKSHIVRNFMRDYTRQWRRHPAWLGHSGNFAIRYQLEQLLKGTWTPKYQRMKLKDVRNLW